MKKWLIIYAFALGFLGLAYTGHASSTDKNPTFYTQGLKLKKGFVVGLENKQQRDNSILLSLRTRTLLSISAFPAIKENTITVACYRNHGISLVAAEKEMLMYDYLQHLFPSHYFW